MESELNFYLTRYKEYCDLFYKQVIYVDNCQLITDDVNCNMITMEYKRYIDIATSRLFTFGSWFNHMENKEYPQTWDEYRDFKYTINA
jgi:hypothetical protein